MDHLCQILRFNWVNCAHRNNSISKFEVLKFQMNYTCWRFKRGCPYKSSMWRLNRQFYPALMGVWFFPVNVKCSCYLSGTTEFHSFTFITNLWFTKCILRKEGYNITKNSESVSDSQWNHGHSAKKIAWARGFLNAQYGFAEPINFLDQEY